MGIPFLSHAVPAQPLTATNSSGTHALKLTRNNNFKVNPSNQATTIQLDEAGDVIGQAGNIIITNPSTSTSLSFTVTVGGTESYIKIPGGSSISYNTLANQVHCLSYYVNASDQVLVNYIGLFA